MSKRVICSNCEFPEKTCLCGELPEADIKINGHVVVLQHPNEKKVNSVRLIKMCLKEQCDVVKQRKIVSADTPNRVLHEDIQKVFKWTIDHGVPMYVLFPGDDTPDIVTAAAGLKDCLKSSDLVESSELPVSEKNGTEDAKDIFIPKYVIFLIDGTWQYAKEMFFASKTALIEEAKGQLVQLPVPEPEDGFGDITLKLRTEPEEKCVTTLECAARCIRAVEDVINGVPEEGASLGEVTEAAMVKVLRKLVETQAQFNPGIKQRLETGCALPAAKRQKMADSVKDDKDG